MNLNSLIPDWPFMLAMLLRLPLALLLGGLIGLERERVQRYAGLRTHMLVCVGSALVMCTGEAIFRQYYATSDMDPARLGAQVVSGIGILCAGTILKGGSSVRGLTTATSLWCASCIGLAVGSGNLFPAIWATLIVIVVLHAFRIIEIKHLQRATHVQVLIFAENTEGITEKVSEYLKREGYGVGAFLFEEHNGKTNHKNDVILQVDIILPKGTSKSALFAALKRLPEIRRATALEEEVEGSGVSL